MMVFRRKGRTIYEAKVPTRAGEWSKQTTGTRDRVTAHAIRDMIKALVGREAWALLEMVTARPQRWTLLELYRRWMATPVTRHSKKSGKPIEPSIDDRIEHVEGQLVEIDLDPLVDKFHEILCKPASGVSEDTAAHYRSAVRLYIPEGVPCPPERLSARELGIWIEEMDDVEPGTVRKRGIGMGRFTAWLVGRHTIGLDPMAGIKLPAQGKPLTHHLEQPDVLRLADTLSGQVRLLEYVLPASALEVSTALQLRVRAVSTLDREIHAPGTKTTSRNRIVRVADFGWDAVLELIKGKHKDSLLFDQIPHRWFAGDAHLEAVDALGARGHRVFVEWEGKPKRYTMRDHRHTWAVRAARSGMPPAGMAQQLGHSDGGVLALKVYGKFMPKKAERDRWELMATLRDQELEQEAKRLTLEGGGS